MPGHNLNNYKVEKKRRRSGVKQLETTAAEKRAFLNVGEGRGRGERSSPLDAQQKAKSDTPAPSDLQRSSRGTQAQRQEN